MRVLRDDTTSEFPGFPVPLDGCSSAGQPGQRGLGLGKSDGAVSPKEELRLGGRIQVVSGT